MNIFGEPHAVRLQVHVLGSFSAHADRDELLAWVERVPRVDRVLCVHGEEGQSRVFADLLTARGFAASVPAPGEPLPA